MLNMAYLVNKMTLTSADLLLYSGRYPASRRLIFPAPEIMGMVSRKTVCRIAVICCVMALGLAACFGSASAIAVSSMDDRNAVFGQCHGKVLTPCQYAAFINACQNFNCCQQSTDCPAYCDTQNPKCVPGNCGDRKPCCFKTT